MFRRVFVILVITVVPGCDAESTVWPVPTTCNGSESLCSRSYSNVVYATTHNAMSNEDDGWVSPNQIHGITQQLEDGVRALMLDTHYFEEQAHLCHGLCALGKQPLVDGFGEIASFLERNRGEVVTIIFESYVTAADTQAALEDAQLDHLVYVPRDSMWPTLREMIDRDERLVLFTDAGADGFAGYLDVWEFAWETHFSNRTSAEFSCEQNRGDPGHALFIFNHFLTQTLAKPEFAQEVNVNPLLIERARECMDETGRLPNFVTVDFYSIGDLFETVDELNDEPARSLAPESPVTASAR